jgi:prephenate dehydratase
VKVAFQGSRGAYSEEAVLKHFSNEKVETLGFALSEQVVEAVIEKEVDCALLPVENSIVGNVAVNMDLFYQEDIYATHEVYLPIHHCLLAHKESTLENLEVVHSHPIALAQCRDFINRHNLRSHPDFDTAGSCALLSKNKVLTQAAIASKLCSQYYNLQVLEENIQKVQRNITRFLLLKRRDEVDQKDLEKADKTSIAFSAHHQPGALLDCLKIFNKYQLNMTRLESRPIPENLFDYIFFVDFMGAPHEKNVKLCLDELNRDAHHVKVLGTYKSTIND